MLRPRNFNKLIHKSYSFWHNSTAIFGCQFLQIQNGNGSQSPCNIPFKYPQLFHRHQFSTENEAVHSLPIEGINSASTIPTIEQNEQQPQHSEMATEKRGENLEIRLLALDNYKKKQLKLKLRKYSAQKFIEITLKKLGHFTDFTKIPVPEDAYAFVRALDRIIGELATEDFEQKLLQIKDPQSAMEVGGDDADQKLKSEMKKLRAEELTGLHHKFQLELVLFPNRHGENGQMALCLRLCAVNNVNDKERSITLPLNALSWLREQMTELLTKHDGTEEIEKEAPAQIPQKFLQYTYMKN